MNKTYFYILLAVIMTGIVSVFVCQNKSGFIKPQPKTETVVTTPPLPETLPSFPPPPTPPPPPPLDFSKAEVLAFPDNKLDTSDWQTYRNEEFGFEVKHPRDWEVTSYDNKFWGGPILDTKNTNDVIESFLITAKDKTRNSVYTQAVGIFMYKKTPKDFTEEVSLHGWYIKKYILVNGAYGALFSKKKENGEWSEWSLPEDTNHPIIFNFKDNLAYGLQDEGGVEFSNFQKILLSFKFTR